MTYLARWKLPTKHQQDIHRLSTAQQVYGLSRLVWVLPRGAEAPKPFVGLVVSLVSGVRLRAAHPGR